MNNMIGRKVRIINALRNRRGQVGVIVQALHGGRYLIRFDDGHEGNYGISELAIL